MFISEHYAKKRWTNHERKSAQARAFNENREYILPVRLDDTAIPGIRETIGYIDLRHTTIEDTAALAVKKVRGSTGATRAVEPNEKRSRASPATPKKAASAVVDNSRDWVLLHDGFYEAQNRSSGQMTSTS